MNTRQCLRSLAVLLLSAAWDVGWADVRLRDVVYDANEVYRLPAYAGYDTDIEFESGEHFLGLGSGDLQGLAFHAELNHLFIKPRALNVNTDITVLTNRRVYHFDFASVAHAPDETHADVLYALRFLYPNTVAPVPAEPVADSHQLEVRPPETTAQRHVNRNYWYCGAIALQPAAAWDDGLQTHLRFRPRQELPALFLKNGDGSESLLNFHIDRDEVIVHRLVQRLILRRGGLVGCVVNRAYGLQQTAAVGSMPPSPAVRGGRSGRDD